MRIAIFGLGYVGSVSAACLAAAGHDIIGVDLDPHKLSLIRQGRSPVTEPGLDELLGEALARQKLAVTDDTALALRDADVSLVCVGTPSRRNGSLETLYLERVIDGIGRALAGGSTYHVVAIRSTLLPGVLESTLIPRLESTSGRSVARDLGVCVNPEFLREGSAIRDFASPPFTLIGAADSRAGDRLAGIYAHLSAPLYRVAPAEASMVKYASNGFHAVKVAFANEIGALCEQLAMDGREVMRIFCEDRDLNISPRYLRPGFGFGGSCLPKDLRALTYLGKERDVTTPLLSSVLGSNDAHIQRVVNTVLENGSRQVALIGLSFKVGSDDLRESPFVRLAEALIGKGVRLRVFDPDVALGAVFGRNRAYLEEHLPHVWHAATDTLEDAVADAGLIIVGKRVPGIERLAALRGDHQTIVDLVGVEHLTGALRPWGVSRSEGHPGWELS
jgi:GDP-mannose 6-dehydrogenase